MKLYIYIAVWAGILLVMEYPIIKKYLKAKAEFELVRQAAIVILMLIVALLVVGCALLGYHVTKLISV